MSYLIHNAMRANQSRVVRAKASTHRGLKQFLFQGQLRLVRGRPIPVTEEVLMLNLEEIQAKAQAGLIYVTLADQTPFDVMTLSPVIVPKTKPPEFRQDSINLDAPAGIDMSKYGDAPPPETFEMPVALPDAAFDMALDVDVIPSGDEEPDVTVEEDEGTEDGSDGEKKKKTRRRRR